MKHLRVLLWAVLILMNGPAASVYADTREEALLQKVRRLQALKETDPAAYEKAVQEKKERVRERLQQFRGQKGEAGFEKFLEKRQGLRRQRLEYFRQSQPQMFHRFQAQRQNRWERIRQRNPEQFRQWTHREEPSGVRRGQPSRPQPVVRHEIRRPQEGPHRERREGGRRPRSR